MEDSQELSAAHPTEYEHLVGSGPKEVATLLPAPMSPTSRVIHERSTAAINAAQAVWEQAQAAHMAALNAALKLDGLPRLGMGEGELRGVSRVGDEWVEPEQPRR